MDLAMWLVVGDRSVGEFFVFYVIHIYADTPIYPFSVLQLSPCLSLHPLSLSLSLSPSPLSLSPSPSLPPPLSPPHFLPSPSLPPASL